MAIVKMKRLRLLAMRADREELLRRLQALGCVEVDEPEIDLADPDWSALTRPDGDGLARAREASARLTGALAILDRSAPEKKKGLFHLRPVIRAEELFDEGAYRAALSAADRAAEGERKLTALLAERSRLAGQQAALEPWAALDVPLELGDDGTVSVILGTIPARADFAAMEGEVAASTDLAQLTRAGGDRELQYVMLVCHSSARQAATEAMRSFGFSQADMRGWTGTAQENLRRLADRSAQLDREVEQARTDLAAMGAERELLRRCADRAAQEIAREEAKARLVDTADTFFLEGWLPAEEVPRLEADLAGLDCAWELSDPEQEAYPQVPVKLKNSTLTRCMNMVTEMYSLPQYGSVDPNPLMAPFFILFYGIMMADMGYGLLMIGGAVFALKKLRPREGMRNFMELLLLCGISTFIVGALTGGFFGDFLPQLAQIIDPNTTFTALPALFTPLEDTMAILVGSLVLGFIQIVTGQVVSFVKKFKDGHGRDGIWDELPWWVIYLGVGLLALGVGNVAGYPVVLIIGIILMVIGSSRNARGFGKVGAVVGAVYNGVTGIFGDVLSYARLMALMLSGSIIASVFNTLGGITGNVVAFVIIAMVGNALNFALNLLGCYVHDLRLQCLEFFKTFYQDGGVPFRPLRIDTKYVDIEEENHHVG